MDEIPTVVSVRVLRPYVLEVAFRSGEVRFVDMESTIRRGKVFDPLRDPVVFGQASVEFGTVVWPGDIDIAPEFLYAGSPAPVS